MSIFGCMLVPSHWQPCCCFCRQNHDTSRVSDVKCDRKHSVHNKCYNWCILDHLLFSSRPVIILAVCNVCVCKVFVACFHCHHIVVCMRASCAVSQCIFSNAVKMLILRNNGRICVYWCVHEFSQIKVLYFWNRIFISSEKFISKSCVCATRGSLLTSLLPLLIISINYVIWDTLFLKIKFCTFFMLKV